MNVLIKTILVVFVMSLVLGGCSTANLPAHSNSKGEIKRQFVDGLYGQVHIRTAGTDVVKPPLVLLHPTPYSSQFYIPFVEEMRDDRRIIAIDTPGYGDSARPPNRPKITDYARNVLLVLDELGIEKPVDVLGYHTGTLIGIEMALHNPNRVNKAILSGVPVYPKEKLPELYAKYAKPDALNVDGTHLASKWKFATQTMKVGLPLERAQAHFSDYMQSLPNSTQAYYGVFTYPGYERLPQITRPFLFVAINGSLKAETMDAHKLTPNSKFIYLDEIETGLFDVGSTQMAKLTRDYLDTNE